MVEAKVCELHQDANSSHCWVEVTRLDGKFGEYSVSVRIDLPTNPENDVRVFMRLDTENLAYNRHSDECRKVVNLRIPDEI